VAVPVIVAEPAARAVEKVEYVGPVLSDAGNTETTAGADDEN
jgi:hypothetical protein